ncbi:MAG: decaprenyl-phosphate phosphoribosyltransferase, partial [Gemmatimonadetes bacterium]|nr:decaprenyl-phosphate phosphoribosyltransferase [Gemmatimonadota bacterium]
PPDHRVELELTISPWLYVCTALLALFITLAKRRGEIVQAGERSVRQRAILAEYSVPFIDQLIAIVAPSTLVAYTLYTFSSGVVGSANLPENFSMLITVPFVAYGIFRYLYLIHQHNQGETPEDIILADRPLILAVLGWLVTSAAVLLANALLA